MNFGKAGNVIASFIKGNYYFGRTLTNRFSSSRATGVFDALAGAGIGYIAIKSGIGSALNIAALATGVATAPVAALVFIPVSIVFLGLSACMVGLSVGLLSAAKDKAGIPTPRIPSPVRKVGGAVADGAGAVKNVFKAGANKLSSSFKSAVLRKNRAPKQNKPAPKQKKNFDL